MSEVEDEGIVAGRVIMALIGTIAGLTMWFLLDKLPEWDVHSRIILGLASFLLSFFAVLLVTLGPLKMRTALSGAAGIAIFGSVLFTTASFRYADPLEFLNSPEPFLALFLIATIPVPFLIVAFSGTETWRSYPDLFNTAWQVFVRVAVGLAFTGVVWLVVTISDQVLRIVGLNVIEMLLRIDPVPLMLTGLALGLGLAVVHELRAYISPHLMLRLLRLLLPLVLVVSGVFLVAAPIKGLSNLFGGISSAAVLMAMVFTAATLITTTLDGTDSQAATSPILTASAQLMALILPILGGLAAWAIWLRVVQYGWTPLRLGASLLALVVLGYGVTYALAVLRRAKWRENIRQSNVLMALLNVACAALWLSPILNAERISTASQMARFESGSIAIEDLDFWALEHEWGWAGQAAIQRLRAMDTPESKEQLALLDQASSRWNWERKKTNETRDAELGIVREDIAVRPIGANLPIEFLRDYRLDRWLWGCERKTPAGNPGCVALVGDFEPETPENEVLILYLTAEGSVALATWAPSSDPFRHFSTGGAWAEPAQIDHILSGTFSLENQPKNLLLMGEFAVSLGEK